MRQHQAAGVELKCPAYQLAREDGGFVHRAVADAFIRDEAPDPVEEERTDLLFPAMSEAFAQVAIEPIWIRHQRSSADLVCFRGKMGRAGS